MRWRSTAARILLVTVVAAMATVVWPAPASAQFGCNSRQAPNPRSPTSGVSGLVAQAPETIPTASSGASGRPRSGLSMITRSTVPIDSRRNWTSKISSP